MSSAPRTFRHHSVFCATIADLTRFHSDPAALRVLTPPPVLCQIVRDERTSLTAGEITFRLWMGPLPIEWVARHEPASVALGFADRMLCGPLASWRHEHQFRPLPQGVELVDEVTYAHPPGWRGALTRLMFGGPALRAVFWYRHWRTRRAVESPTRSQPAAR
jgi:ligand-binding SRPBCC domain-containing protein